MLVDWGEPCGALLIPGNSERGPATVSRSALYEAFQCPECFSLVMRNDIGRHAEWHRSASAFVIAAAREAARSAVSAFRRRIGV